MRDTFILSVGQTQSSKCWRVERYRDQSDFNKKQLNCFQVSSDCPTGARRKAIERIQGLKKATLYFVPFETHLYSLPYIAYTLCVYAPFDNGIIL